MVALTQAAFPEAHPNDCDGGVHLIEIIFCCVTWARGNKTNLTAGVSCSPGPRLVSRLATPAESFATENMASTPVARQMPSNKIITEMTLSTPCSVRQVLANMPVAVAKLGLTPTLALPPQAAHQREDAASSHSCGHCAISKKATDLILDCVQAV